MKRLMLAVAAIVAVSSLTLVSCSSKSPADKAKGVIEQAAKDIEANPEKAAEIQADLEKQLNDIVANDCKTLEDSMAVFTAMIGMANEYME